MTDTPQKEPFDIMKALGAGVEDIDRSILGMPFLAIIQSGSPEIKKSHAKYEQKRIDGAKEGDIFFVPEKLLLKQPIRVIPLAQTALYSEWRPRNQGGGFIGYQSETVVRHPNYHRGTKALNTENKEYLGENELLYTIFVLLMFQREDGTWTKGIIPFTSTQLKHAREWMKNIIQFRWPENPSLVPPIFARSFLLTSEANRNAKGDWFGWVIRPEKALSPVDDAELLEKAFQAHKEALTALPSVSTAPVAITETESTF